MSVEICKYCGDIVQDGHDCESSLKQQLLDSQDETMDQFKRAEKLEAQIIDRQNWEMRAHTAEKVNKVLTRQLHEQRALTLEAESRVRVSAQNRVIDKLEAENERLTNHLFAARFTPEQQQAILRNADD